MRWFQNKNGILQPQFDIFPDVSDYSEAEQFAAPSLPLHMNETAKLFSSRHPKTIQRYVSVLLRGLWSYKITGTFIGWQNMGSTASFCGAKLVHWRLTAATTAQRQNGPNGATMLASWWN